MKTLINLNGIELELLQPYHALARFRARLDSEGNLYERSAQVIEEVLCEETVADLILDLHTGEQAVVWSDDAQAIVVLALNYNSIVVKTVLDSFSRDFCYAGAQDVCIYKAKGHDAEILPTAIGHGRFRVRKPKNTK